MKISSEFIETITVTFLVLACLSIIFVTGRGYERQDVRIKKNVYKDKCIEMYTQSNDSITRKCYKDTLLIKYEDVLTTSEKQLLIK